jgi:hypothetical protein
VLTLPTCWEPIWTSKDLFGEMAAKLAEARAAATQPANAGK